MYGLTTYTTEIFILSDFQRCQQSLIQKMTISHIYTREITRAYDAQGAELIPHEQLSIIISRDIHTLITDIGDKCTDSDIYVHYKSSQFESRSWVI
jgi:hypothetical protein